MRLFHTSSELRHFLKEERCKGKKIGLIPTMGALHEGHLSLIKMSVNEENLTVASVFVNPIQFNNNEDLKKYPRNLERDSGLLSSAGCDVVFAPEVKEMYPNPVSLNINFGPLERELEGRFRPGHFAGVGLVVSKLFNLVQPDHAYFGQKDLQQYFIIKNLTEQLSFPIKLHMAPTKRESSGLAMSSRNERLSTSDRHESSLIYSALTQAREMLLARQLPISEVRHAVVELFKTSTRLNLEYFEVINTTDFKPLDSVKQQESTALCIAAEIGGVRLIDNLLLIS